MDKDQLNRYRYFLKDSIRKQIDFRMTDQNQGVPVPPMEAPCPDDAHRIDLPAPAGWKGIPETDLTRAIGNRKSHRVYIKESLSLDELAYLLWATQGVRGKPAQDHACSHNL